MLTLKIMSEQNLPDDSPEKDFTLIQIADSESLSFVAVTDHYLYDTKVLARVDKPDGSSNEFPLTGNAYVLNANGKTIASRCSY